MVILGAGFWGFPHFRDQKRPGGRSKAMAVSGAPGVEEDLQRPIHRIHRSGFGSGGWDQVRLNPPRDVADLGDEHVEKWLVKTHENGRFVKKHVQKIMVNHSSPRYQLGGGYVFITTMGI